MLEILGLDHYALGVKDLQKSVQWYTQILGLAEFKHKSWGDFPVFLVAPNQTGLALFPKSAGNPVAMPQDRKSGLPHIAFRVNRKNFRNAQDHLKANSVPFDFQDHHNAHSIYFRDPDDYCIEITTYDLE